MISSYPNCRKWCSELVSFKWQTRQLSTNLGVLQSGMVKCNKAMIGKEIYQYITLNIDPPKKNVVIGSEN